MIATGQRQSTPEYRLRHRDGTWRWFSSNFAPLFDASSTLYAYVGIASDITPRKRAEAALQRSELTLNIAQELGRMGSFVFVLGRDYGALCRHFGFNLMS